MFTLQTHIHPLKTLTPSRYTTTEITPATLHYIGIRAIRFPVIGGSQKVIQWILDVEICSIWVI